MPMSCISLEHFLRAGPSAAGSRDGASAFELARGRSRVPLQGIPIALKEAARIDGAGGWQVIRHVIIPTIKPYTLVVSIIATIAALRTFGEVYVMTGGGPFQP